MNRPTTLKAKVSVSPHAVSIKFKHSKYKITKSKTRKVRITLRPSITKEKPVYTVLNTRIATINKKGVLRGKRPGTTYVTATLANGVRAKCKIVVKSADKYPVKNNSWIRMADAAILHCVLPPALSCGI